MKLLISLGSKHSTPHAIFYSWLYIL